MELTNTTASTVTKALDILFHLHEKGESQGVSSIAGALGMQKSGVHRLLKSLEARRLVEQMPDLSYSLGVGLITLASGVSGGDPLISAASPVIEELAKSIGETVFLVTDHGGELRVAAKYEGSSFLRAAPELGSVIPAAKTAVGKLYATHAPDRLASVPRYTTAAKREIREKGFAANLEEWQPGLSVVAVPVMDGERFAGALALATVAQRMELLSVKKLTRLLIAASDKISTALP